MRIKEKIYIVKTRIVDSMKYLLVALLIISGVSAASQTTLFKGSGIDCELIPEKEVLVYTQVFADYDGQTQFDTTFNLPGPAPYVEESEATQQHLIFNMYDGFLTATVNDMDSRIRAAQGQTISTLRIGAHGGGIQLILEGDNHINFTLQPNTPVREGDLLVEIAATTCSDAAWETALDAPVFPDTEVPEFPVWAGGLLGVGLLGLIMFKR